MHVIAFDPGATTGYIRFADVIFKGKKSTFTIDGAAFIPWHKRYEMIRVFMLEAQQLHRIHSLTAIVIETFRLRRDLALQQAGSDMPAPRIIECISTYAYELKLLDLICWQEPLIQGSVKTIPEHLKNAHIISAYKHAYYYTVTHQWDS